MKRPLGLAILAATALLLIKPAASASLPYQTIDDDLRSQIASVLASSTLQQQSDNWKVKGSVNFAATDLATRHTQLLEKALSWVKDSANEVLENENTTAD